MQDEHLSAQELELAHNDVGVDVVHMDGVYRPHGNPKKVPSNKCPTVV